MKQAIHIFRKDVRRLWPQLSAWLLAVAGLATAEGRSASDEFGGAWPLLAGLMVVVISMAIHEEPLAGGGHFWLTRPYSRRSLLLAKTLLVVAFIIVPLFAADCVVLYAQGLEVTTGLGALFLRRIVMAAMLVVPVFAISSVTRNIALSYGVFTLAVLYEAVLFGSLSWTMLSTGYLGIVSVFLLLLAIWRQYSDRRTWRNTVIACGAYLLPLLAAPLGPAPVLALEQKLNPPPASLSKIRIEGSPVKQAIGCLAIGGEMSNVPEGIRVTSLAARLDLRAANGDSWESGWRPDVHSFNDSTRWNQFSCATSEAIPRFGHKQPLTLHASLLLMVAANTGVYNASVDSGPFTIPGGGICEIRTNTVIHSDAPSLLCREGPAYPLADVAVGGAQNATSSGTSVQGSFLNHNLDRPFADISAGGLWPHSSFCAPRMFEQCELGDAFHLNVILSASPVFRSTPLDMDRALMQALEEHGTLQFRTWKHVAIIRREVTIHDVRIPVLH